MALADYKVTNYDAEKVESQGNTLVGTALENKKVFDKLALHIIERYNAFIDDYMPTILPSGDAGLGYDSAQISTICSILECQQSDITL